jgi:copper transport protein
MDRRSLRFRHIALISLAAAAFAAAMLLAPWLARDASAHAVLISSNPENGAREQRAPLRVVLRFSEPVEPRLTEISVTDIDGNRVDGDDVVVGPEDRATASVGIQNLDPGLYTVEFANVSTVDGHPWTGIYQFIILNRDGTVPAGAEFDPELGQGGAGSGLLPRRVDVALKWLALLSLATVAGAAFALAVVGRPAAAFLDEEPYQKATDAAERWLVTIAHVLLPVAFIAMAVLVGLTVSRFTTSTSLWEYVTSVRTGQYRLALEVLTLVALAAADVFYLARRRVVRDAALGVLILAAAGGLLTYSLTSHGAADAGAFWAVTSDYIHLAASAAWLGALVMLLPVIAWARRELGAPEGFLFIANVFDRFSVVAGASVALILASGTFNGLAQIPNPSAMVDTTYGRVLVAKLALMMPLLGIAALNAWYFKPRLVGTIDALYQEKASPTAERKEEADRRLGWLQRVLPRTIGVEIVLLLAVFASVAVLTQTSTARGEVAQEEAQREAGPGFRDVKEADGLQLEFGVTPNRVGINEYTLRVTRDDGAPVDNISEARLRISYIDPAAPADAPDAQAELMLQSRGNGVFVGQGSYFTQQGSWRTDLRLRRPDGDDVSRSYVVLVSPPQQRAVEDESMFDLPFTAFTWNEVVAAVLVIGGALIFVYRRQLAVTPRVSVRMVDSFSAVAFITAAVLAFGVHVHQETDDIPPASPESIERGRVLYQQNCLSCHGERGDGMGPDAAGLNPSPADFRQHLPFHDDPTFRAIISQGLPGTAMPAFGDELSQEQIQDVINYLRSEFGTTQSE